MTKPTDLSLIIPAHNEDETLEAAIDKADRYAASVSSLDTYEILIVENGSDDRTPELSRQLEQTFSTVQSFSLDSPGKGNAIQHGIEASSGSVVAFFDADLATDMKHLSTLYESIALDGFDVATGSRMVPGNEVERPVQRRLLSEGFNRLVRTLLRSSLRDHLCGFKSFDRTVAQSVVGDLRTDGWFWDAELLVLCQKRGYQVKEFPVDWSPGGSSSISFLHDIPSIFSDVVKCTWWYQFRNDHST